MMCTKNNFHTPMTYRTNVVINRPLINKAKAIIGASTIRETIDRALEEVVRRESEYRILQRFRRLRGSGCWVGDLNKMRKNRV